MIPFRNSSAVTSPLHSMASSRRSSIGQDDHLGSFINRDPFGGGSSIVPPTEKSPYAARKYSSLSLPRNFSMKQAPTTTCGVETKLLPPIDDNEMTHENLPKVTVPAAAASSPPSLATTGSSSISKSRSSSGDGIQRKYRRIHKHPIPGLLEKAAAASAADCPSEGCANNHKSFNLNFSVLVECWRCNSLFFLLLLMGFLHETKA